MLALLILLLTDPFNIFTLITIKSEIDEILTFSGIITIIHVIECRYDDGNYNENDYGYGGDDNDNEDEVIDCKNNYFLKFCDEEGI